MGDTLGWPKPLVHSSIWLVRVVFKESYFRDLLGRSGWVCDKHNFPLTDLGTIFVARRSM